MFSANNETFGYHLVNDVNGRQFACAIIRSWAFKMEWWQSIMVWTLWRFVRKKKRYQKKLTYLTNNACFKLQTVFSAVDQTYFHGRYGKIRCYDRRWFFPTMWPIRSCNETSCANMSLGGKMMPTKHLPKTSSVWFQLYAPEVPEVISFPWNYFHPWLGRFSMESVAAAGTIGAIVNSCELQLIN